MTINEDLAKKILDEIAEYVMAHSLCDLVHEIIGEDQFIFNEIMAGYAANILVKSSRTIKMDEDPEQLIERSKHFCEESYKELSRKSDKDIHITLEESLSDYPDAKSTEVYPVFNLVLHWMNSMGISPIFAAKFTDRKELRMKIGDFVCYYFDFVIAHSPEEPRKQGALDLYGVVNFRDNLKELAIDFLMEGCDENNKSVSSKNEVPASISSDAKEETSTRRKGE